MLRAMVVCLAFAPSIAMAADTLVVRGQDGSFSPGLAESWKDESGVVRFTLSPSVDPTVVAQALTDSIVGVQVKTEARAVLVSGVPMQRLLEQTATITVGGDPLAQIASISGGSSTRETESGGSIRASKPQLMAALLPHDATDRFEAEVLEVQRGEYPSVALKLKVKRSPKTGPFAKALAADKIVTGLVVFTGEKAVNMAAEGNQRNAGAFYIQPKDRVFVHLTQLTDKGATIDWIERAVRK